MNQLNNDNIDEIIFQLLEGEIKGTERKQLLEAIEADEKYAAIWATWQKTILNTSNEILVMDTQKLKKKTKKPIVLWLKYVSAACILLSLGFLLFNQYKKQDTNHLTIINSKDHSKSNLNKIPEIPKPNTISKDTFLPFKEKVKWMVNTKKPTQNKTNDLNIPKIKKETKDYVLEIEKPELIVDKTETPKLEVPKSEKTELIQMNHENNIIVSFETEIIKTKKQKSLKDKITETSNLLTRIFSKPKLQMEVDTTNLTKRNIILKNKEYKIIAGF